MTTISIETKEGKSFAENKLSLIEKSTATDLKLYYIHNCQLNSVRF